MFSVRISSGIDCINIDDLQDEKASIGPYHEDMRLEYLQTSQSFTRLYKQKLSPSVQSIVGTSVGIRVGSSPTGLLTQHMAKLDPRSNTGPKIQLTQYYIDVIGYIRQ